MQKGPLCGVGSGFVPVASRRAPRASHSALTSDGAAARGRCLFAHRGKAGVALSRGFLNSLRPTGSWFFPRSARYERAATWRRGGRHRYVPCAINAVRRVATKNAGLPCLVPAGRATAYVRRISVSFCPAWSSGGGRRYRRPAVFAVIAPNPVHDDRELARDRDFGASHANSFRQPQAPALQD